MITVNTHEAKTNLSKLLAKVSAGETVIIANDGKPVAKLTRIANKTKKKPRKLGFLEGKVTEAFFEPLSDEDLEAWYK